MSVLVQFEISSQSRREQLLAEAETERLVAQLPRQRRVVEPRLTRAFRKGLARALYAVASWLSPEVAQPEARFLLASAGRRNGVH